MNSNKWYKFLITEAEQEMMSFSSARYDYAAFEDEFTKLWESNEYFRTAIIRIIIEKMLIPTLKRLPKDVFLQIKEAIMNSSFYSMKGDELTMKIHDAALAQARISHTSPLQYIDLHPMMLFLNLLFFPKDPVYNRQVRDTSIVQYIQDAIYYLFSNYPELIPKKPKLSRGTSKNKEDNLKLINAHFFNDPVEESEVQGNNILDDVKLTEYIGGGVYGKVFKTSDDQALKIFMDSVSLQKDLDRMSKVVDEVYQGSASLSDMHYFDYGQLGTSPYYYALMPLIVPLEKAPFFDLSPVFSEAVNASYDAVGYFRYRGNTPGYTEFKDQVLQALPNLVASYGQDGLDDINRYKDTINAIIYAAYRASTEYKGTDLHSGNIGYFAQKPDKFFFYDM